MWSASNNMSYFPSAVPDSPPLDKPTTTTTATTTTTTAGVLTRSQNPLECSCNKPLTGEQGGLEERGVVLSFGSSNERAPLLNLQLLQTGQNGYDIDGYASLIQESKAILQTFADFILDVCMLLEKECSSIFDKIRLSLLYLECYNTVDQVQLEPCHFFSSSSAVAQAKTMTDLLAGISQCSSWFNYDTVAYIVKRFGGIEGIKLVEGYELALTDYLQKLMIHCPPFLSSPVPPVEFESLDTKVSWDVQGCILQDIAIFKNTLCRILKLDPAALVLKSVDSERCMLSWAIPNSMIKHTISYASSSGDALTKENVQAVRVGAKMLDISRKKTTNPVMATKAAAQSPLTRAAKALKQQDLAQSPSRINGSYFQFYYKDCGSQELAKQSLHTELPKHSLHTELAKQGLHHHATGATKQTTLDPKQSLHTPHQHATGATKLDRHNKALSHSFSHVPRQTAAGAGFFSSQKTTPKKFIFPPLQPATHSSDRIKSMHLFHSNSIEIDTRKAPNVVTVPQNTNEKPPLKVSMSQDSLRCNGGARVSQLQEKHTFESCNGGVRISQLQDLEASKNADGVKVVQQLNGGDVKAVKPGMQTNTCFSANNVSTQPQPEDSSAVALPQGDLTADASIPTQDATSRVNHLEKQCNGIAANRMFTGSARTPTTHQGELKVIQNNPVQKIITLVPYVPKAQDSCLPKTSVGFLWRVLGRASPTWPANLQVASIQTTEIYFEGDILVGKGHKLRALYRESDRVFVETLCGERGFVPYTSCRLSRKYYGPKSTLLMLSYSQLYLQTPDNVEKRENKKRESLNDIAIEMVAIEEQSDSSPDELSVKCGEKIRVLYCDDSWVFAVADNERAGIIPRVSCRMTKMSLKTFEKWIEESGLFQCDYVYKYCDLPPAILSMTHLAVSLTDIPAAETTENSHSKIGKVMTIVRSFVPTSSNENLLTIRKGLRVIVQNECNNLLRVATKSGTSFWIPSNYLRPAHKNSDVGSFLVTSTEAMSDDSLQHSPNLYGGTTTAGNTAVSPVVSTPQNLYEAITNEIPSLKRRLNSSYEKLVSMHADVVNNGLPSAHSEPDLSASSHSMLMIPASADSIHPLPYPAFNDLEGEIIC